MNIIQVQDRLKGVSDDALKGYVTNPTGDVPTYLALGEIGRREDVRKEYQAAQADQPQKTVAEEKLAAMPQGIGALTQGMMPQAPQNTPQAPQGIAQPPMASMNPAIAQTGVANLPTQNFEAGGVVGYKKGGGILSGIRNFFMGKDNIPGKSGGVGPNGVPITTTTPIPGTRGVVGIAKDNPKKTLAGAAGLAYLASGDDEEEMAQLETPTTTADGSTTPAVTTAPPKEKEKAATSYTSSELPDGIKIDDVREYGQDKMERYKELIGDDESKGRMKKRLDTMEQELTGQKEDAANMAMMRAGLAIASGTSDDAITNIAEGGLKGINGYVEELRYIREQEGDIFDMDMEIAQSERREELMVASKGYDSEQAAEARNITAALKEYDANEKAKEANAANAAGIERAEIASSVHGHGVYGHRNNTFLLNAYSKDQSLITLESLLANYTQQLTQRPNDQATLEQIANLKAQIEQRKYDIREGYKLNPPTTPTFAPNSLANIEAFGDLQITD